MRGRVAGQRHVDRVALQALVQLGGLQRHGALGQLCLQGRLDLVAALADRAPLLGRQILDRSQHRGQLGLAAQQAHAQLLQLGGAVRRGDGRLALRADLLEAGRSVSHGRMTSRRGPAWPPWPRSAILGRRAAAGFARARRLIQRHRWADLRARHPRARSPGRRQAPARLRRHRRPAPRWCRAASPRAGGRANTDPMAARTALGPYGSAVPGPMSTGPSASACADRMTVPTLPGSPTPYSATLRSPPGSAQRWWYTPITRVPEPSARDPVEQLWLHVLAGPEQHLGLPAGRRRGSHQVVALGHEQARLVPRLLARELADELQLGVVG